MHLLEKFRYCPVCGSAQFVVNDFKSKRCGDCGFTYYFNAATSVIAIITNERGELLVARRAVEPEKGKLGLIGGFVDPGESCEEAILREIEEETGIRVEEPASQMQILFTIPNTYLYSGLLIHSTDCFFHIRIGSETLLRPDDDVAACWWMKIEELRLEELAFESAREGLRRFLKNPSFEYSLRAKHSSTWN